MADEIVQQPIEAEAAVEERAAAPVFEWDDEYPGLLEEEKSRIKGTVRPPQSVDFWEKTKASFGVLNSVSSMTDLWDEGIAKQYGSNGVSREDLVRNVPPQYHGDIIEAAEQYNDDAALAVRDNILEDIGNNKIFDSMPWYAQAGFGAVALAADPLTLVPSGIVAKGAVTGAKAARTWQTSKAFKQLGVASSWFAAGATETAIQASPRLAADYTYNSSDYVLDTLAGGLIGAGMASLVENRALLTQFLPDKNADASKIAELEAVQQVYDPELGKLPPEQQTVEIQRRQNIVKLKDEYAESISASNERVQEGLATHILNQTGVEQSARGAYTSKPISADTPSTATLATEIHHGQQVLVEVKTDPAKPGATPAKEPVEKVEVVPNRSENLSADIDAALETFTKSGEQEIDKLARKSNNPVQAVVRGLNKVLLNNDLSTTLANSKSKAMNYVAARITETGQGFGGKRGRDATAAIVRDSKFRDAQMELVPAYRDSVTNFAAEKGGALSKFRARNEAGVDNPVVEQFNREFMTLQELRRQGKNTDHISPSIKEFAEGWNKSMDVSFNNLVGARVAGFSAKRKIKDYYTQSWLPDKLIRAQQVHGKDKVRDVIALGYRNAAGRTEELSVLDSNDLATRLLEHIRTKQTRQQLDDEFVSTAAQDARSKARLNIDTTAEIDGMSVLDLLDTDVIGVGTRYNNRAAGWSALSNATDGLINSDEAVQAFRTKASSTGASDLEVNYLDDVMEMMLGKPVRGGLNPALREFKDLAALAQLGGKGMAQLAETGQVVTRGILKAFNDPKNLARMMKDAKGGAEELSTEAQRLSHLTNDMEWLERQSTHTDTAESIGQVAVATNWLASKATGGNRLKANSGRLLGKLSGFNMVRRTQTRIVQAGLMREISDQLLRGKSAIGADRLKDLGVLNSKGTNPFLAATLRQHATLDADGNMVKMNFEKWPKKQQDEVRYALLRDDAQNIQRTMIGELPGWMNSPMMSLLMQYREMPLVAMNKSLGRATAFADREAVIGVTLSAMTAALAMSGRQLVVGGSDATIGGGEFKDVDLDTVDVAKYINAAGMYPDLYDLVVNDGWTAAQNGSSAAWGDFAIRQVPTLGLAKGYADTATSDDAKQLIDNTQTLLPLGNTMLGDAVFTFMMEKM